MAETVKGQLHVKATVSAEGHRLSALDFLTGRKNHFTGICFFRVVFAQKLHSAESICNLRVSSHSLHICFKALDIALLSLNFRREIFEQLVLHAVLLALVVSFQHLQAGNLNIQIHLFLNQRITGTQRLDFRIGQGLLIHIIAGADRRF